MMTVVTDCHIRNKWIVSPDNFGFSSGDRHFNLNLKYLPGNFRKVVSCVGGKKTKITCQ